MGHSKVVSLFDGSVGWMIVWWDWKATAPGWFSAKETWFGGWLSRVAILMVKGRDRREFTVGAMSRPWGTAREPFWGIDVSIWLVNKSEEGMRLKKEERIEVEGGV